uniref:Uncharacterized protein n=1 Tax=Avena sativa TaxID=4498 RepID=A0ACD5WQJ1_AVESA
MVMQPQNPMIEQEPRQHVREALKEGEFSHGDGSGALVSLVQDTTSQIDMALLHCQACQVPLKPLLSMRAYEHVVCCVCRGCHDEVDLASIPCASKQMHVFGSDSYGVYHKSDAHTLTCHFGPCACPEPGCGVQDSPLGLLNHFSTDHFRPIIILRYGVSWNLSLPLSQSWHVVVGQEDQSVFLVTLGKLGAMATAVSLVCVRAEGTAATTVPQFWCKLSVEHPGGDKVVLMASTVSSTTMLGGAPTPTQGMFLVVPQELISGEMLDISVRIDKVRHGQDDAATTTTASC